MAVEVDRFKRWAVTFGILLALVVGGLAGSLLTAKTGRAPFGVGNTVPILIATPSPVPADQVSFANGFSSVASKDVPAGQWSM